MAKHEGKVTCLTNREALEMCRDRIRFCANLYGSKWEEENRFLKACESALEEIENRFLEEAELDLITHVFQNYYSLYLSDIAEEDETAKNLFEKIGLL